MTIGEPVVVDNAPPEQAPYPEPAARNVWWHRAGLVGAIVGFAAAGLTVAGSLLELLMVEVRVGRNDNTLLTSRFTAWGAHSEPEGRFGLGSIFGEAPENGAPLVFAAVAVFAGAAIGLFAARHPAGIGYRRAAVLTSAVGAAFLAAMVWTIGMQEAAWFTEVHRLGEIIGEDDGSGLKADIGTGFWLLLVAAGAAIGAAVCAVLPAPDGPPAWNPHDPATPRYGLAVVTRLPDAEPDPPREE